MQILFRFLINIVALILIARFVPGIEVHGIYTAIIVVIVLGLLNALIRPLLILLTLPITIITLGLFVIVINALLFWFVGTFVQGFEVAGFVPALIGALIMSIVSWFANWLLKEE